MTRESERGRGEEEGRERDTDGDRQAGRQTGRDRDKGRYTHKQAEGYGREKKGDRERETDRQTHRDRPLIMTMMTIIALKALRRGRSSRERDPGCLLGKLS